MKGIIAAPGMAFAKAHIITELNFSIDVHSVADASTELKRLRQAISGCSDAIKNLMGNLSGASDCADSIKYEILDFQLLLLDDTEFIGKIEGAVSERRINCEYAVKEVAEEYVAFLENIDGNEYLRERTADVLDLSQRLIAALTGVNPATTEPDGAYIAIGADIPPSRVAGLDKNKLKGIILEKGGITSHSVILSKSLGIPCLIKTAGILEAACEGAPVLLDCQSGEAVIGPDGARVAHYQRYAADESDDRARLGQYVSRRSASRDGAVMKVYANITGKSDAAESVLHGAEGVGLFRSELLYMSQKDLPPSEEMQYLEYSQAAAALDGRPLVIRTLDAGGDKQVGYLNIECEQNPFLGYRAIRYCLDHPEIFMPQLLAILRAGAVGDVRLMFPMITCKAELLKAKQAVAEAVAELRARGAPYCRDMKIGIMVETPAAAADARILAKEADFFSIGTNDLSQYLFAADRGNAKVSGLISNYQPALLRAVYSIVGAAHEAGIEADICGDAAGADLLVPVWLAMGVDNLSVGISRITAVRRIICNSDKAGCQKLLERVLCLETADETEAALRGYAPNRI